MRVPDYIIDDIQIEVKNAFEDIYIKHIEPHNSTDFPEFCETVLSSALGSLSQTMTVDTSVIDPIVNKRWRTKKRWLDRELAGDSVFGKEVDVVARGLFEQFADQPEKFRAVYDCDTYEELRQRRLDELDAWASNAQAHVCYFPYLKGKQPFQIEKAMKNDIEYVAFSIIKERCPTGMQSAILALPNSMSNIPIDFTSRVKMDANTVIQKGRDQFFVNKYYIDDDTFLENLMNVEILKTGVVSTVLKTLNATDVNIFLYVMSLRDENFFTTREIVMDIGGIVRNVFSSDAQFNYMTVKESLYRMQHLNSGAIDASLRGFTVKIFDYVDIRKANDGKEMATVIVSINIVNEYIKNQTINMYRHIIDKFNVDSAKVAIFALQRERIRCSATAKEGEPLLFQANLNFFRRVLYLSNKKKKENIRLIEVMLNEIVANHITLKSYERNGDTFTLEFYPITERERKDLISYRESERLLDLPYEQLVLDIH